MRRRIDFLQAHRSLSGIEEIGLALFVRKIQTNTHILQEDTFKITKQPCQVILRKYSFTERVINDCKVFPIYVASSPSINVSKNHLKTFWKEYPPINQLYDND